MSIEALLAALLALPAAAAPAPSALDVLRMGQEGPSVPYEGELLVRGPGSGREKVLLVRFAPPARYRREVADRFGLPELTVVSDGRVEWVYDRREETAWKGEPADPDYKLLDPDEEYGLLARNYDVSLRGEAEVVGRRAWVVEVRAREDGRTVRRVWVDQEHGLVLERRSYRSDGREASWMRFNRLRIGAPAPEDAFSFVPPAGARVLPSRLKPDYLGLEEAAEMTGMRPRPPAWLPAGYVFESVNLLPYRGATLLHYRYSDGVDVLSLFQCPPGVRLARSAGARGRRPLALAGGRARLSLSDQGKVLEWESGDRFVLVGDLPSDALKRVAESLR